MKKAELLFKCCFDEFMGKKTSKRSKVEKNDKNANSKQESMTPLAKSYKN